MKREQNLNCLVAFLLAFCMAFGGVGCMVTGLKLEVSSLWMLALACAAAAAVGALCYRFRHGGWALTALLAAAALWYGREPERMEIFLDQSRAMLHRMTSLWNHAYGWHVVSLRAERLSDLPLMLIGAFVAMVVARTVCRRKRAAWAAMVALPPLCACLVVTDTVPDTAYLFTLLLGLGILLLTNSVRRFDLGQGLELTAMAALATALGLTMLFGLAPREDYVNNAEELQDAIVAWAQDLPARVKEWGQTHDPGAVEAVQTQKENLSTLGRRIQRDYPVLHVTSTTDGLLYLRGQDFDSYDGKTWTATRNRVEAFPAPAILAGSAPGQVQVDARRARDVLYVPYYVSMDTPFIGGRFSNEEDVVICNFNRFQLPENWRDTVNAVQYYDEGVYATAGLYDSAQDQWRYRILPLETKARAEQLLAEILPGDGGTATGKADAIAEYVRNSASYSLDPGTMPPEESDFALWFLEEQTEGYCVHFATATAVLLRAAGIDARYVTGYVLEAKAGQTVTVPAKQAHAWVEYFEPRLGAWVVLESTPADLTGSTETETTAPVPETAAPTESEETVPQTQPKIPEKSTQPEETKPEPTKKADIRGLLAVIRHLLTAAALSGAVLGQYRLRLHLRRKRQNTGSPNSRCLALWSEMVLLHRLLKTDLPEKLEMLAQKAKFSQHSLTREELRWLEDENRAARQQLQRMPVYRRIVHRIFFAAY